MPAYYGLKCATMKTAREMLEYCRFAYKMYSQTCKLSLDPFFETWGPGFKVTESSRDRLIAQIHDRLGTTGDIRKFDPIEYKLDETPNPHLGSVYRGGEDTKYILFVPRPLDLSIGVARGFDIDGDPVGNALQLGNGRKRCGYFQGRTGMTANHEDSGWTSYMGAVIYDEELDRVVIVFRGSRSGSGARALVQAQFKSKGSPDWVTDMNHLKGMQVSRFGNSTLAVGFWRAYESCRESLESAYRWAVGDRDVDNVFITGHSLGGALATCAYVDMVAGALGQSLGLRDDDSEKWCFPISAPPICHGQTSQHWLSLHAGGANVMHYYCPMDCVHASPLVTTSALKKANWVIGAFSHPLTDPMHIGSETALDCQVGFPDAHEPEQVWLGMNGGVRDPRFWPVFDLNVVADEPVPTPPTSCTMKELTDALRASYSMATCRARAAAWQSVVKDSTRKVLSELALDAHDKSSEAQITISQHLHVRGFLERTDVRQNLAAILKLRKKIIEKVYTGASGHGASSSCAYTVLLSMAVQQILNTN